MVSPRHRDKCTVGKELGDFPRLLERDNSVHVAIQYESRHVGVDGVRWCDRRGWRWLLPPETLCHGAEQQAGSRRPIEWREIVRRECRIASVYSIFRSET